MGCRKLTYYQTPELRIISNRKELTLNKSVLKERSDYLYGFNGMEKDDEAKGAGNHYSFSDYGLDPRTGRRWNMDPIFRHNMSSYLFGANNPIIFIDPDGTTEFYFNGKWIGTDGIDNNIIGVVTSKNVRKNIIKNTKEGNNFTGFLSDVKNGTKTNGVFYVNSDILKEANGVLTKAIVSGNTGETKEFTAVLTESDDGGFENTFEGEGQVQDLATSTTITGETLPEGDVSIHSHPTTSVIVEEYGNKFIKSGDASDPSPPDKLVFKDFKLNIIVGKNKLATGKFVFDSKTQSNSKLVISDTRGLFINFFDSNSKLIQSVSRSSANTILSGDKGKLGEKFKAKAAKKNNDPK